MTATSIVPASPAVNPIIVSARRAHDRIEVTLESGSDARHHSIAVTVPGSDPSQPVEDVLRLLCAATGTDLDVLRKSWGESRVVDEEVVTANKVLDRLVSRLQLILGHPLPEDLTEAAAAWRDIVAEIEPRPSHYSQSCSTCGVSVPTGQLIRVHTGAGIMACGGCDPALRTAAGAPRYGLPVQTLGAFRIPDGYLLAQDGIWLAGDVEKVELTEPLTVDPARPLPAPLRAYMQQIVPRPLVVLGIATPLDAHEVMVRLCLRTDEGRRWEGWVPRSLVADARLIRELAQHGYPVTSNNAARLVHYVGALLDAWGPQLPSHLVGTRFGTYVVDDRMTFVLGDGCIGSQQIEIADPHHAFRRALTPSGEQSTWRRRIEPLAEGHLLLRVALAASFAAALVRILQTRTFVVLYWGPSRTGKTTLAKLSLTVWGDPQQLSSTLNSTQIAATSMYSSINDLPYLLDELQVSTVEVDKLLYALASGQSRGRADVRGKLQPEFTWSAVIQMTGEQPVLGQARAHDLGGQANRVLELPVGPEDALSPEMTRQIYEFLDERCYGHAGRAFLQGLAALDEAGQLGNVRERYREIRATLAKESGIEREHTTMAAVLATAWYVARVCVFEWSKEDAWREALDDALAVLSRLEAERDARPLDEQVLELLQDDRLKNPSAYFGVADDSRSASGKDYVGYEVGAEVWIIPSAFSEIMRRNGIAHRRALTELERAGHLVVNEAKSKTCHRECRPIGVPRRRFYVFRRGTV